VSSRPFSVLLSGILVVGTVALVSGCVPPPAVDLSVSLPDAWQGEIRHQGSKVALNDWWKVFHDARLDALVDEALKSNQDVEQAVRRLKQAQILADGVHAGFLPGFLANAHTEEDLATTDNYLLAGVNMLWDPGLFGAKDSAQLAGKADVAAAQAQEQGIRVQVVADVVKVYLDLQAARLQLSELERVRQLDLQAIRLVAVRQSTHTGKPGEAEAFEEHASRVLGEQARVREARDIAMQTLAVLLGRRQPDKAWRADGKPFDRVPEFGLDQVPADLLRTRPDIRLAEAQVLKAAADLGISRSALYPRFSLEGSLLYSYNLSTHTRAGSAVLDPALGPVIDIPLWDWGLRRSRVSADEQALDAALAAYRQTVLEGVADVENALSGLAYRCQRGEALKAILEGRQERLRGHDVLFAQGLASRFDGISAQRDVLEAQMDLDQVRFSRGYAFVALYKALGGAPLPRAQK